MKKCIFCKLISKNEIKEKLYEDNKILVMLDVDWAVKGHTLVIWKKHFNNVSELPLKDFKYFSEIVHKVEKILLKVLKTDRSIILKSGGLVSHFHFHIYPLSSETSWKEIKNIFDKKIKYKASEKEREEFISSLKTGFQTTFLV